MFSTTWLSDAHHAGLVYSIAKVRQELNDDDDDDDDDDPVRLWANDLPESFFIPDTQDSQVMRAYGQVMQWNVTNDHYRQQAKDEFARFDKADAFLVAVAFAHGFAIVTH